MATEVETERLASGIYRRRRRFRVPWQDGERQRWASFATLAEAQVFRSATRPTIIDNRDPETGRMVAEAQRPIVHCPGCDRDLPRCEFFPRPSRPKGIRSRCRDCVRAAGRDGRARARNADPEGENEKWKAWARTPKGQASVRAAQARRRGAYDCAATDGFARDVLSGDPCSYCGSAGGTIDHIDPFSLSGDGSAENLTGACIDCNRRKNALPLLAYLLRRLEVA